jgi:hypothetical protein
MDDFFRVPCVRRTHSTRVLLCAVTIEELIVLSRGKWEYKLHRIERSSGFAALEGDRVEDRRDDDRGKTARFL